METFFLTLLNRSAAAGWVVLAVLLLRLLLGKAPKWIRVVLWGFAAFRLIAPVSPESRFSLVRGELSIPQSVFSQGENRAAGNPVGNEGELLLPSAAGDGETARLAFQVISVLWLIGVLAMLCYLAVSSVRVRRRVREAVWLSGNVWECDALPTPFVFGILRPRIFLPSSTEEADRACILLHERAHVRRRDPLWKLLGFLLLSVYWFHPLLWLAYFFFCRDLELACDEKVIREHGEEMKKPYSRALIRCAAPRKGISVLPPAFGETGIRERVKNVLRYRKPPLLLVVCAAVVCAAAAVCLLTSPPRPTVEAVFSEDAFVFESQTPRGLTLSFPLDRIPEPGYSEGAVLSEPLEVYRTDTTAIRLESVQPANGEEDWLDLVFAFVYDLPDSGSFLAPYCRMDNGSYGNGVELLGGELEDGVWPESAFLRSRGPGERFTVCIPADALAGAQGTMELEILCYEIRYRAAAGQS